MATINVRAPVWVKNPAFSDPNKDELWIQTVVEGKQPDRDIYNIRVKINGKDKTYKVSKFASETDDLKMRNPVPISEIDNILELPYLNEPEILFHLRERYDKGATYTYSGGVLLSVNPYDDVKPTDENQQLLKQYVYQIFSNNLNYDENFTPTTGDDISTSSKSNPSDDNDIISNRKVQVGARKDNFTGKGSSHTIVISGESGSGKSVCFNTILDILSHGDKQFDEEQQNAIIQEIQSCNTILELFGNAKTVHTFNSSRFGKLIAFKLLQNSLHVIHCSFQTYLLETSRIIVQNKEERNFNMFYAFIAYYHSKEQANLQQFRRSTSQRLTSPLPSSESLLHSSGSSDTGDVLAPVENLPSLLESIEGDKKKFHLLTDINSYFYLTQGGQLNNEEINYYSLKFVELLNAFDLLQFHKYAIDNILYILSGILAIGNITFDANHIQNNPKDFEEKIYQVAELFGLEDKEGFLKLLTKKRFVSPNGEILELDLDVVHSIMARDAIVRLIYRYLFFFLVEEINSKLEIFMGKYLKEKELKLADEFSLDFTTIQSEASSSLASKYINFVQLLDIFGFDSFEHNSIDQMLINYANEMLHKQFNSYVFQIEMELYENENINYDRIEYSDNTENCELLGNGIFRILDDQCRLPHPTDKRFIAQLYKEYDLHPLFSVSELQHVQDKFSIKHYSGNVEYSADDFINKNIDFTPPDTGKLMAMSSNSIISKQFSLAVHVSEVAVKRRGSNIGRGGGANVLTQLFGTKKLQFGLTLATQFKNELNNLLQEIDKTSPHYIKCIKSYDAEKHKPFSVIAGISKKKDSAASTNITTTAPPAKSKRFSIFTNNAPLINKFVYSKVADQLRSNGILEAVRIALTGYQCRMFYRDFYTRYRLIASEIDCRFDGPIYLKASHTDVAIKLFCNQLCDILAFGQDNKPKSTPKRTTSVERRESLSRKESFARTRSMRNISTNNFDANSYSVADGIIDRRNVQFGETKIFLKLQEYTFLEAFRNKCLKTFVSKITQYVSAFVYRKRFIVMRMAIKELQRIVRGYLVRKRVFRMKILLSSVLRLQREWRKKRFIKAIKKIQNVYRLFAAKQKLKGLKELKSTLVTTYGQFILARDMRMKRRTKHLSLLSLEQQGQTSSSSIASELLQPVKLPALEKRMLNVFNQIKHLNEQLMLSNLMPEYELPQNQSTQPLSISTAAPISSFPSTLPPSNKQKEMISSNATTPLASPSAKDANNSSSLFSFSFSTKKSKNEKSFFSSPSSLPTSPANQQSSSSSSAATGLHSPTSAISLALSSAIDTSNRSAQQSFTYPDLMKSWAYQLNLISDNQVIKPVKFKLNKYLTKYLLTSESLLDDKQLVEFSLLAKLFGLNIWKTITKNSFFNFIPEIIINEKHNIFHRLYLTMNKLSGMIKLIDSLIQKLEDGNDLLLKIQFQQIPQDKISLIEIKTLCSEFQLYYSYYIKYFVHEFGLNSSFFHAFLPSNMEMTVSQQKENYLKYLLGMLNIVEQEKKYKNSTTFELSLSNINGHLHGHFQHYHQSIHNKNGNGNHSSGGIDKMKRNAFTLAIEWTEENHLNNRNSVSNRHSKEFFFQQLGNISLMKESDTFRKLYEVYENRELIKLDNLRIISYNGLQFQYMPVYPGIEYSINSFRALLAGELIHPYKKLMKINGTRHLLGKSAYYSVFSNLLNEDDYEENNNILDGDNGAGVGGEKDKNKNNLKKKKKLENKKKSMKKGGGSGIDGNADLENHSLMDVLYDPIAVEQLHSLSFSSSVLTCCVLGILHLQPNHVSVRLTGEGTMLMENNNNNNDNDNNANNNSSSISLKNPQLAIMSQSLDDHPTDKNNKKSTPINNNTNNNNNASTSSISALLRANSFYGRPHPQFSSSPAASTSTANILQQQQQQQLLANDEFIKINAIQSDDVTASGFLDFNNTYRFKIHEYNVNVLFFLPQMDEIFDLRLKKLLLSSPFIVEEIMIHWIRDLADQNSRYTSLVNQMQNSEVKGFTQPDLDSLGLPIKLAKGSMKELLRRFKHIVEFLKDDQSKTSSASSSVPSSSSLHGVTNSKIVREFFPHLADYYEDARLHSDFTEGIDIGGVVSYAYAYHNAVKELKEWTNKLAASFGGTFENIPVDSTTEDNSVNSSSLPSAAGDKKTGGGILNNLAKMTGTATKQQPPTPEVSPKANGSEGMFGETNPLAGGAGGADIVAQGVNPLRSGKKPLKLNPSNYQLPNPTIPPAPMSATSKLAGKSSANVRPLTTEFDFSNIYESNNEIPIVDDFSMSTSMIQIKSNNHNNMSKLSSDFGSMGSVYPKNQPHVSRTESLEKDPVDEQDKNNKSNPFDKFNSKDTNDDNDNEDDPESAEIPSSPERANPLKQPKRELGRKSTSSSFNYDEIFNNPENEVEEIGVSFSMDEVAMGSDKKNPGISPSNPKSSFMSPTSPSLKGHKRVSFGASFSDIPHVRSQSANPIMNRNNSSIANLEFAEESPMAGLKLKNKKLSGFPSTFNTIPEETAEKKDDIPVRRPSITDNIGRRPSAAGSTPLLMKKSLIMSQIEEKKSMQNLLPASSEPATPGTTSGKNDKKNLLASPSSTIDRKTPASGEKTLSGKTRASSSSKYESRIQEMRMKTTIYGSNISLKSAFDLEKEEDNDDENNTKDQPTTPGGSNVAPSKLQAKLDEMKRRRETLKSKENEVPRHPNGRRKSNISIPPTSVSAYSALSANNKSNLNLNNPTTPSAGATTVEPSFNMYKKKLTFLQPEDIKATTSKLLQNKRLHHHHQHQQQQQQQQPHNSTNSTASTNSNQQPSQAHHHHHAAPPVHEFAKRIAPLDSTIEDEATEFLKSIDFRQIREKSEKTMTEEKQNRSNKQEDVDDQDDDSDEDDHETEPNGSAKQKGMDEEKNGSSTANNNKSKRATTPTKNENKKNSTKKSQKKSQKNNDYSLRLCHLLGRSLAFLETFHLKNINEIQLKAMFQYFLRLNMLLASQQAIQQQQQLIGSKKSHQNIPSASSSTATSSKYPKGMNLALISSTSAKQSAQDQLLKQLLLKLQVKQLILTFDDRDEMHSMKKSFILYQLKKELNIDIRLIFQKPLPAVPTPTLLSSPSRRKMKSFFDEDVTTTTKSSGTEDNAFDNNEQQVASSSSLPNPQKTESGRFISPQRLPKNSTDNKNADTSTNTPNSPPDVRRPSVTDKEEIIDYTIQFIMTDKTTTAGHVNPNMNSSSTSSPHTNNANGSSAMVLSADDEATFMNEEEDESAKVLASLEKLNQSQAQAFGLVSSKPSNVLTPSEAASKGISKRRQSLTASSTENKNNNNNNTSTTSVSAGPVAASSSTTTTAADPVINEDLKKEFLSIIMKTSNLFLLPSSSSSSPLPNQPQQPMNLMMNSNSIQQIKEMKNKFDTLKLFINYLALEPLPIEFMQTNQEFYSKNIELLQQLILEFPSLSSLGIFIAKKKIFLKNNSLLSFLHSLILSKYFINYEELIYTIIIHYIDLIILIDQDGYLLCDRIKALGTASAINASSIALSHGFPSTSSVSTGINNQNNSNHQSQSKLMMTKYSLLTKIINFIGNHKSLHYLQYITRGTQLNHGIYTSYVREEELIILSSHFSFIVTDEELHRGYYNLMKTDVKLSIPLLMKLIFKEILFYLFSYGQTTKKKNNKLSSSPSASSANILMNSQDPSSSSSSSSSASNAIVRTYKDHLLLVYHLLMKFLQQRIVENMMSKDAVKQWIASNIQERLFQELIDRILMESSASSSNVNEEEGSDDDDVEIPGEEEDGEEDEDDREDEEDEEEKQSGSSRRSTPRESSRSSKKKKSRPSLKVSLSNSSKNNAGGINVKEALQASYIYQNVQQWMAKN